MFFSTSFSRVSDFARGISGDTTTALQSLSECIDLANQEIDFRLLRKLASLIRIRDCFGGSQQHARIADLLLEEKPINIVFINDNGVFAGAGIGVKRQAQSFAKAGHHVSIMALNSEDHGVIEYRDQFLNWCQLNDLHVEFTIAPWGMARNRMNQIMLAPYLLEFLRAKGPDTLVIFGNLHSCEVSPSAITQIIAAGYPCVFYAHDLDWVTGGCAYPQSYQCHQYRSEVGCLDSTCPMPEGAYPMSSFGRKTANCSFRDVVLATGMMPIFTNSDWTSSFFESTFPSFTRTYTTMLATDTQVFSPSAELKQRFRSQYGIPDDALVVSVGADNNSRTNKGGQVIQAIVSQMQDIPKLVFLSFGHGGGLTGRNVISCGFQPTEASMAEVFQAADVFLNMASFDCFGQVSIEAAACGCIPIVLAGSGTAQAINDQINGLIVNNQEEAMQCIHRLLADPDLRAALSERTCHYSSRYFSLESQYIRWITSLMMNAANGCSFRRV